jgi:hypothetical protein
MMVLVAVIAVSLGLFAAHSLAGDAVAVVLLSLVIAVTVHFANEGNRRDAVAGSPLYDPEFDAVVQEKGGHPRGDRDYGSSLGGISVLSGSPLTTWSSLSLTASSQTEYALRLLPDSPVVVGRFHGLVPPYLDPAYRPTTIVPGTGQAVLQSGGCGTDLCVSRAHFMLLGVSRGILFVNGVPRLGGGIRPPLNGTHLVAPQGRGLSPGEEYLIESGTGMVIRLPNGTELRIDAQ